MTATPGTSSCAAASTWRNVQLYPTIVRQISAERFVVARRGSRRALQTTMLGALAVRQLARNQSVAAATGTLERKLSAPVDLSPLLGSLHGAGMIRAVDGTVVDHTKVLVWDQIRGWWRAHVDLQVRATTWLATKMPPRFAIPAIALFGQRRLRRARRFSVQAQSRWIWPTENGAACRGDDHIRAMAWQDAEVRVICQREARSVDRWLRNYVDLDGPGLEALRETRTRRHGGGVIVALMHHEAYAVVPMKLLATGVSLEAFHFGIQFSNQTTDRFFQAHPDEAGWAPLTIHRTATPRTIAAMAAKLRAGAAAIVTVDFARRARDYDGKESAAAELPIGPRVLRGGSLVGWLARKGEALIVPATGCRQRNGRYRIWIGDPIRAEEDTSNRSARRDADVRTSFNVLHALAPTVAAAPHEWTFLSDG